MPQVLHKCDRRRGTETKMNQEDETERWRRRPHRDRRSTGSTQVQQQQQKRLRKLVTKTAAAPEGGLLAQHYLAYLHPPRLSLTISEPYNTQNCAAEPRENPKCAVLRTAAVAAQGLRWPGTSCSSMKKGQPENIKDYPNRIVHNTEHDNMSA